MTNSVIIDLEHVARKNVHAVISACTLSLVPFSAIYVLHSKSSPIVVPLPLSESLVKLPLNFVRIPTLISRSKDVAVFLSGYLTGCKGISADDDVWFVSSRSTWFTPEILNCKTVSTVRTTEELVQFSSSIGVDISISCSNAEKKTDASAMDVPVTVNDAPVTNPVENALATKTTTTSTTPKTKRVAKSDVLKTTSGSETVSTAAPVRGKKQKRADVLDVNLENSVTVM